jgi:hypothetical protein
MGENARSDDLVKRLRDRRVLRKVMKECGMNPSNGRLFVQGRLQHVVANTAAMQQLSGPLDGTQLEAIKGMVLKPNEVLEGAM